MCRATTLRQSVQKMSRVYRVSKRGTLLEVARSRGTKKNREAIDPEVQ
jgi:hypothetical protein